MRTRNGPMHEGLLAIVATAAIVLLTVGAFIIATIITTDGPSALGAINLGRLLPVGVFFVVVWRIMDSPM